MYGYNIPTIIVQGLLANAQANCTLYKYTGTYMYIQLAYLLCKIRENLSKLAANLIITVIHL